MTQEAKTSAICASLFHNLEGFLGRALRSQNRQNVSQLGNATSNDSSSLAIQILEPRMVLPDKLIPRQNRNAILNDRVS